MLAMNRLRHAYLEIAPGLEPYFTTGHHDDAPGLAASFLLPRNPGRLGPWGYFLVNTPTVLRRTVRTLAVAVLRMSIPGFAPACATPTGPGEPWFPTPQDHCLNSPRLDRRNPEHPQKAGHRHRMPPTSGSVTVTPPRHGRPVRRVPRRVAGTAVTGQVRVRAGAAGGSGVRAGPRNDLDAGFWVDQRGDAEQ